jgi:DNA-binding NarL/FixJ family response regulator
VVLADAYEVVRAGLVRIVESRSSWEVVAVAGDGKEAVQKAIETKPDIAVIGYALPLINGIEVARQIRARLPKPKSSSLAVHDDEAVITQLLYAGARGYLLKSDANRDLLHDTSVRDLAPLVYCARTARESGAHNSGTPNCPIDRRGLHKQGDSEAAQHRLEDG